MTLETYQVPPAAIEVAEGIKIDMPAVAYVGIDDGVIVGSYGLAWGGGRCWCFLKLTHPKPSYALPIARRMKSLMRKARQLAEVEIFTPRDTHLPTSEKLLKVLGFEMYAIENGIEVWRKDLLQPSPTTALVDTADVGESDPKLSRKFAQ